MAWALVVLPGNGPAIALYQRNGFADTGAVGDLLPDGVSRERLMAEGTALRGRRTTGRTVHRVSAAAVTDRRSHQWRPLQCGGSAVTPETASAWPVRSPRPHTAARRGSP
ncbi:hypothetical protein A4G23_03716 [Streptomyces rubrolavendulae]|uniref:Uncharacterized protein n=1 Tax=Streptomyces rubrolavendulae TaxID=285473 RepID=A0A1D8G5X6_9ACTN|nr:hypothetical protein A4G23_03716 [Streptomyces rubrolavendulae]